MGLDAEQLQVVPHLIVLGSTVTCGLGCQPGGAPKLGPSWDFETLREVPETTAQVSGEDVHEAHANRQCRGLPRAYKISGLEKTFFSSLEWCVWMYGFTNKRIISIKLVNSCLCKRKYGESVRCQTSQHDVFELGVMGTGTAAMSSVLLEAEKSIAALCPAIPCSTAQVFSSFSAFLFLWSIQSKGIKEQEVHDSCSLPIAGRNWRLVGVVIGFCSFPAPAQQNKSLFMRA